MSDVEVVPELSELIGSMIFCSERSVSVSDIRKCLQEVAEKQGGAAAPFASLTGREIRKAVNEFRETLEKQHLGFQVCEVAGGFRLQSDPRCGAWVRQLLKRDKPNRLSRPALETLAIIAYRQPISRAEIESVRGVAVGHLIKTLMEIQLVRISGRSEMPGRPFLYGTTTTFLDHFGLTSIQELKKIDPALALNGERSTKKKGRPAQEKPTDETVGSVQTEDQRTSAQKEASDGSSE